MTLKSIYRRWYWYFVISWRWHYHCIKFIIIIVNGFYSRSKADTMRAIRSIAGFSYWGSYFAVQPPIRLLHIGICARKNRAKNDLMFLRRLNKILISLYPTLSTMTVKIWKDLEFDINAGKVVKRASMPTVNQGKPLAVIYCRVSTDGQVTEGNGITSQEEACKAWCERNQVECVKVFKDEGISGTDLKRQGIHQAIAFLKEENAKYTKIRYFVCTETSRISRSENLMATLWLEYEIKNTGVDIVYAFSPMSSESDESSFINNIQHVIAAHERKRISKRCKNGSRAALLLGKRPFSTVPLWYISYKEDKQRIIEIDPLRAEIIKEGLELFADDVLLTKWELLEFLNIKWLKTGAETKTGKLYITFLEKLFLIHRLMFMAGYIIYPNRDINELIEAQHPGLISLDTAYKILQKINKKAIGRRSNVKSAEDVFLLRGMVRCPLCKNKITTWHTTSHTGKKHPYYWCVSKSCEWRRSIKKAKMEGDFFDLLKSLQMPKQMYDLFDKCLEQRFLNKQNIFAWQKQEKRNRIREVENKMKLVEESLLKVSTPGLITKYEADRALLNQEKEELNAQLDDNLLLENDLLEIIKKTKDIFRSPLAFWELWDLETRQLLVRVWFGNELTYTEQDWYHTSQKSVVYSVLEYFRTLDYRSLG